MKVSYRKSHGTMPLYLVRGYRDAGWLLGFNTRFGGRYIWIRRKDPDK